MKINIVAIAGGLGNQMFQYAYYHNLKRKYKFTFYLVAPYYHHNGFELDSVFKIKNNTFLNLVLRIFKKTMNPFIVRIEDSNWGVFENKHHDRIIQYHTGYWQNEMYFKESIIEILNSFKFDEIRLNPNSKDILTLINSSNSIGLHIRRGDYLSCIGRSVEKLTLDYYYQALEIIKNKVSSVKVFVFSDDQDWVKENLITEEVFFVDSNKGSESWQDMFLMSKCKHNIIANSTFSWWGAYLNNNPYKIVVAPKKWFVGQDTIDHLPQDWIII